jgi:hypothetical protein
MSHSDATALLFLFRLFLLVLGWIVALGVTVAIHEAGHALAAQAVGFRLHVVRLGPLMAVRTSEGFRLLIARAALFSGLTGAFPRNLDHTFRRKVTIYMLAGVFANFMYASAGAVWLLTGFHGGMLTAFLVLFVLSNATTAVLNALPVKRRTGLLPFDGKQLQLVLTGDPAVRAQWTLATIVGAAIYGSPIRDTGITLAEALHSLDVVPSPEMIQEYAAAVYALEAGDVGTGRRMLESAFARNRRLEDLYVAHLVAQELAVLVAVVDGDSVSAQRLMRWAPRMSDLEPRFAFVQTAIASASGDVETMERARRTWDQHIASRVGVMRPLTSFRWAEPLLASRIRERAVEVHPGA